MSGKCLILCLFVSLVGTASAQILYQNPKLSSLERAKDVVSRLTLDEKASLMMNDSPAIPRLGIPQFEWWSEALHGVARNGFATVFPATIGMAASFDDTLLYDVYSAVSDEARAKNNLARRTGTIGRYQGVSFWTPNINIFRDPRWGRGQETYGEDPYLTSRMGCAVVNGLQGQTMDGAQLVKATPYKKLLACAKHFAVHSGPEWSRHTFDIEKLPVRDLWETYLPAFKSVVQDAHVAEVMCAYQSIDGEPCCANSHYEQQILRDEWGFNGLITSDCGAVSDFYEPGHHLYVKTPQEASAKGVLSGTDVECGSVYKNLPKAVKMGLVSESKMDTSLVRLFKARFDVGDFESEKNVPWKNIPESVIASMQHKELAYRMAQESMVLLQNNDNILPLNRKENIIVMGPNANDSIMQWGNYTGYPTSTTTILRGIEQKVGPVKYIPACGLTRKEVMKSLFNEFVDKEGKPGMTATYWNNTEEKGAPVAIQNLSSGINLSNGGNTVFAPGVNLEHFSASYEGTFCPEKSDTLEMNLAFDDCARLIIDNDTVYEYWKPRARVWKGSVKRAFVAGRKYHFKIDYCQNKDMAVMNFGIGKREKTDEQQILNEVKNADVVVFVGGISPYLEGEEMKVSEPGFHGGDRTSIELPQAQRDVIQLLKNAGKKVVYVNCSGSAVAMLPETKNAEAILQAWYPGEEGGKAVADVLFGDYNPSGKLPITFYRGDSDLPDFQDYRMTNRTYRYFKGKALSPFGYGLSYTTFKFGKPQYKNGQVIVDVTNTGKIAGTETVEVYEKNIADVDGPIKTLRGFKKVFLQPGKTQKVIISFPRKDFEGWDEISNTIRVVSGKYKLMVGSSSLDKDLQTVNVNLR